MPLIPADDLPRRVLDLLNTRPAPAAQCTESSERRETAEWPLGSVEQVLTRRHAVRRFADEAISLADLTEVLDRARGAERAVWPAQAHGAIRYTILCAAFRVTGLGPPGLYCASADPGPMSPVSDGPPLSSLGAQYADAACLLFICASIPAACAADGPGYAPLLIRAGTLGYAAWLAALGLGLAGCLYAAPHRAVTRTARLLDGESNHLFTTSLGVAGGRNDGTEISR